MQGADGEFEDEGDDVQMEDGGSGRVQDSPEENLSSVQTTMDLIETS